MNLPIPEFRDSCLPDDADSRDAFLEFQELVRRFEPALKTELRFFKGRPLEFPQILASWLFTSLQRVRVTSWGVISSVNTGNEVLFVLAIRALIESTAYIAYIDHKLHEMYDGKMTRKDMTYLAFRMKFSTRLPTDFGLDEREAKLTSSVNVLTAIRQLDRVVKEEFGFRDSNPITTWYERLCEFCHPNALGNSTGSELDVQGGTETFDVEPVIREAISEQFGRYLRFTAICFCMLYNRCWEQMLEKHEALPEWTPRTDPRILAE